MIIKTFQNHNGKITILMLALLVFSCSTPIRDVTYLNGIETGKTYPSVPLPDFYKIRPNDQLFIQVISDDPLNTAFLNLTGNQNITSSASTANGMEIITYLVDELGNIEYPYLGKISVGGLTVSEVKEKLQEQVDKYLQNASVFVKLVNRSITVLGEVRSPGQIPMVKNQLSIFEALGAAGDITDYGNRKNVKVIRELEDSKLIVELDLTNPNLITSPYFLILPHDVIIVEHSTKVYGAKNMPYAAPLSITATVLSTILLALSFFRL